MFWQKLVWIAATGLLFGVMFSQSQSSETRKEEFVVGPGEILAPKGVFLLIRKGREVGAIQFTEIEQGSEVGTGRATYESYFQRDGTGSFRSRNVEKKTGVVDLKPLKGVGRMSFQLGKDKIQVGKWAFRSGYPGRIDMWPYRGSEKDYGYEFAPTSARSVSEIDTSDKRLQWFRLDKDRRITLPVAELPK
jgi:hypothetical protein